ncbi:MAG TPA: lipid-A-disaccharide synthase, partial [Xanthobacteraceae bacterium]|nr:lipid-A-disaccharide synthase [Xanthobacteraceae bacterium]
CTYVGHPVTEVSERLRPSAKEQARRDADPPLVLVLPGSRSGEVRRMLPVFGEAVRLAAKSAPLEIVLPTVPHLAERVAEATAGWQLRPRIVVDQEEKWSAFRNARAALAASGTVTLELAVAGVPTIVAYKISLLEELVARLMIKTHTVVLANLVLGENVMPETLQRAATAESLAAALVSVVKPSDQRQRQLAAFRKIDDIMSIGREAPAAVAADIVLRVLARTASR